MGRQVVKRALWPALLGLSTAGSALGILTIALVLLLPLPGRQRVWSQVIEYRDGRPARIFLADDDKWRLPVALDDVDPRYVAALVALEDKRFWDHDGVDATAMVRAVATDVIHGRRVSGGSTLTMQLARMLEPRPRTIRSKLIEVFRATQLDLRMSKRQILETYLARAPFGGNVEGVESAAWMYFGHGAAHLTPLEIATLLSVPQGPSRFAPKPANTARLRARRDAILAKLIAAGVVSGVDATTALAEATTTPPPEALREMPHEALAATQALRRRYPDQQRVRSTLDAGIQAIVEHTVELRAPALQKKQIHGGAIVVVDHHAREVVALVGSLDWDDDKHGGQIPMFERPRSPGSTLKPLLYALAIDQGVALPQFLVADVPTQYGTYRPTNFDGNWQGLVTLEQSLVHSLNLPFVDLLDQFGVEKFVAELRRMGVAPGRTAPGTYGLSLIAGGIELSPLELAGLYATIANDGMFAPIRLVQSALPVAMSPVPIFGRGAAYLTRQALSQKDRPDFPNRRAITGLPPDVWWKTGTSFGLRDAWAVGSGATYTAVVWTGNVDRKASADLVGSQAAGPLLFDVLDGLADRARRTVPEAPPDDLAQIEVCAYSGHIPGPACTDRVKVLAPIHAVPTEPCPYHVMFEVDVATGQAALPACRAPGAVYDEKSFTVLPSVVSQWLVDHHRAVPDAPVFEAQCSADVALAPPVMTSPAEGQVITLVPGVPEENQQVPLTATTRAAEVSWFVDGALISTGPASTRVYWIPSLGKHTLVVRDEAGHSTRHTLLVTTLPVN